MANKIKRTHTFDQALLDRLERAAKQERRAVSEQLAILLEDALGRFEKSQATKEKSPGPLVLANATR